MPAITFNKKRITNCGFDKPEAIKKEVRVTSQAHKIRYAAKIRCSNKRFLAAQNRKIGLEFGVLCLEFGCTTMAETLLSL
jgi:hypothetical protein